MAEKIILKIFLISFYRANEKQRVEVFYFHVYSSAFYTFGFIFTLKYYKSFAIIRKGSYDLDGQ